MNRKQNNDRWCPSCMIHYTRGTFSKCPDLLCDVDLVYVKKSSPCPECEKHKLAVNKLIDWLKGECDLCPVENKCRGLLEINECQNELRPWAYEDGK